MADSKVKTRSTSIGKTLQISLTLTVLLFGTALSFYSYFSTFAWTKRTFDQTLTGIAALVEDGKIAGQSMRINYPHGDAAQLEIHLEPFPSALYPDLGPDLADGFYESPAAGSPMRVLLASLADGSRFIVAYDNFIASRMAAMDVWLVMWPLLLVCLLIVAAIWLVLRLTLKPVREAALVINQREDDDLTRIPEERLPVEIKPFVESINGLFCKLESTLDRQRRFIADAAHELRTPLTALSLQAESIENEQLPAEQAAKISIMRSGLSRTQAMLNQLLVLARAQENQYGPVGEVKLGELALLVLEDFVELADAKSVDLGLVDNSSGALARAPAAALSMIMRNLLKNALTHAPAGSKVDIQLRTREDDLEIVVTDDGSGIPEDQREKVFEPFYRVASSDEGSGLGLAIVRKAAAGLGGSVRLDWADSANGAGLKALVRIPDIIIRA